MNLATGTKLGPYEVLSPLGSGGMGEVYRARDTRLDRAVAVKILPERLSSNPERRQRFDREARAISSLSHPHICSLYDVGQQDGIDYLVMEYIEGESLADRLKKGALPLNQALMYAIQVADALDKAHRAGIVHRDLKPANIMLTRSGAKLLDFGLAKLLGNHPEADLARSNLPTEPIGITGEGTIVGTFQYMAPEQLEAGQVDARTDIFAFGAVLYEMITGRRAFTGKSRVSLIGAILKDDPSAISTIQPMTPPALERVVKTCLEKDPDERWQNAHDLMRELKWVAEPGSEAATRGPVGGGRNRERLAWIAATATLLLALIAALPFVIAHLREPPVDTRVIRLSIPAPTLSTVGGQSFAISPDGRRLAFVAADSSGKPRLWVRQLDSLNPQPLPGTDGASSPFWSPDSRFIGFFGDGKLKKIDVSGGSPQTLCDAPHNRGGTWNRDGVIVFAPRTRSALYRVTAAGGEAAPLTTLEQASEYSHRWPQFLPDGRHYLYLSRQEKSGIYLGSLDSKETRRIVDTDFNAAYAPQGYLLFVREAALMAQPFDAGKLELTGEPSRVAEQVRLTTDLNSHFTASENGVLVFQSGGQIADSQLAWHDRAGKQLNTVGPPGNYVNICLSPDEDRVAFVRREKSIDNIWLIDIAGNTPTRFIFVPSDSTPIWSPDGSRIVFSTIRNGPADLYVKPASGSSNEEPLLKTGQAKLPTDWSSDGKLLIYQESNAKGKWDLWILPLQGDWTPRPFLQNDFNKINAKLSPDGKWMAYCSDESGQPEVYVQPFPGGGGKYQISIAGGGDPRWRRDGNELFYISADGKMMAVEVKAGSTFAAGATKPLFDTPLRELTDSLQPFDSYAVSRDGQRFLINDFTETSAPPLTVVLNWTADLKRN
jgi:serine/threonine protein kinase